MGLSPFASLALTSTQFVIADAALAGYQGMFEDNRVVLAAARPRRQHLRRFPLADTGESTSTRAAAVRCAATNSNR